MSAMWFDSNALEMTTAEHCRYLTKFCELLVHANACGTALENLIIIKLRRLKATTVIKLEPALFKFYKNLNWSLHYSKSKDWESFKLNHKHSRSLEVQVGLQQHLNLQFSRFRSKPIYYVPKNNNQCRSCGLSSFRPAEVILKPSRKIRNTQLRFVFLNFSFVCQNNLRWSKTQ